MPPYNLPIDRVHNLIHIAVDGRALVEHPTSAEAQHLLEWIGGLPGPETNVSLVHPEGELPELPPGVRSRTAGPVRREWDRLRYDQITLPRAAAQAGADLLLIFSDGVPLKARIPIAAVPLIGPQLSAAGIVEMLRKAAGRAGLRGANNILIAADLDGAAHSGRRYPPFVSPPFLRPGLESAGAERRQVLCYDTNPEDIRLALAAWTWVDGSLGDTYPLQFLSWNPEVEELIARTAAEFNVAESVMTRPPTKQLSQLYREAAAFLSVRTLAWGQPFRWALASGAPVAAFDSPSANSILGDAGYLVTKGDTRRLGAACLSLLVQDELADSLRIKGLRRAAAYRERAPIEMITELAKPSRSTRGKHAVL